MRAVFFCQDGGGVEQMVLALRLRWPDLTPLIVSQGTVGLQLIEREKPDFVMICEDLPNLGICAAIREIRRVSDIPIIVATEEEDDSEMQVVKALELGADDYITMPCNLMVVIARVVALLRRVGLTKRTSEDGTIHCGDLVIDPANYEVFLRSDRLALTPTEFRLLCLMAKNRHVIISRDFIQRVIWGRDVQVGDTLKKYIQRLRRKLGDDARNPRWIKTVHGVGYRFHVPAAEPVNLLGVGAAS